MMDGSNPELSFQATLKAAAQTLHQSHVSHIKKYREEIQTVKEENKTLAAENERLKADLKLSSEKCERDHSDIKVLQRELADVNQRLSAPCENCCALQLQIEQQQNLFKTLLAQKELSISHILDKYLGDKRQQHADASHMLQELSQAVDQPYHGSVEHRPSTSNTIHEGKADETSPNSIGAAKLKLTKPAKRNRYTVIEDAGPMKKRRKQIETSPRYKTIKPRDSPLGYAEKYGQPNQKPDFISPPRFHVPETCAFSPGDLHKTDTENSSMTSETEKDQSASKGYKKLKIVKFSSESKKPNIQRPYKERKVHIPNVIPETVPMDFDSDENEGNNSQDDLGGKQIDLRGSCNEESADIIVSSEDEASQPKFRMPKKLETTKASALTNVSTSKSYKIISYKHNPMNSMISNSKQLKANQSNRPVNKNDEFLHLNKNTLSSQESCESKDEACQMSAKSAINTGSNAFHTSTPVALNRDQYTVQIDSSVDPYEIGSPPESPVFGDQVRMPKSIARPQSSVNNLQKTCSGDESSLLLSKKSESPRKGHNTTATRKATKKAIAEISEASPSMLSGKIKTIGTSETSKVSPRTRNYVPIELVSDGESSGFMSKAGQIKSSKNTSISINSSSQQQKHINRSRSSPVRTPKKIKKIAAKRNVSSPHKLELSSQTSNSDKRLLQTKLSADAFVSKKPGPVQRAQIYNGAQEDPDAYTQQEEAWLEQAKEASLKELDQSRDHSLLLTEPRFTSTPAPPKWRIKKGKFFNDQYRLTHLNTSEAGLSPNAEMDTPAEEYTEAQQTQRRSPRFKIHPETKEENTTGHFEPSEAVARCYNDTMDPQVRLSEYDQTYLPAEAAAVSNHLQPDEGQEMISFVDLDRADRARDTQEYLLSLQNQRVTRSQRLRQSQESGGTQSQDSDKSDKLLKSKKPKVGSKETAKTKAKDESVQIDGNPSVEITDQDEYSVKSAVFEPTSGHLSEEIKRLAEKRRDDFDRVPQKKTSPNYKYTAVVRKQNERQQLTAYTCNECEQYFGGMGLSAEEKAERMKSCRHRAKYVPPDTPEHFWEIDFPDTQTAKERGYLNVTQAKPSKSRRRRPLRKLFKTGNTVPPDDEQLSPVSDIE